MTNHVDMYAFSLPFPEFGNAREQVPPAHTLSSHVFLVY
jgi:hypothetical protein